MRPDLICRKLFAALFGHRTVALPIENLLLQATDLGYGTCWCGFYPVMERVEKLQNLLQVSSIPLAVVAVGKAEQNPDARGFFEPSKVTYLK